MPHYNMVLAALLVVAAIPASHAWCGTGHADLQTRPKTIRQLYQAEVEHARELNHVESPQNYPQVKGDGSFLSASAADAQGRTAGIRVVFRYDFIERNGAIEQGFDNGGSNHPRRMCTAEGQAVNIGSSRFTCSASDVVDDKFVSIIKTRMDWVCTTRKLSVRRIKKDNFAD